MSFLIAVKGTFTQSINLTRSLLCKPFLLNQHSTLSGNQKIECNANALFAIKEFSTKLLTPHLPDSDVKQKIEKITKLKKEYVRNPFILFYKSKFHEIKGSEKKKVSECMKEIGKIWRELPFEEKFTFIKQAESNRTERIDQTNSLFSDLSLEQTTQVKKKISSDLADRRKALKILRKKKQKRKMKCPKRPVNSFTLYLKTLDRGDASLKDFLIGAGHKWQALPLEEKQVFQTQSKENMEKYMKELKAWEIQMITENKANLIRSQTFDDIEKTINTDHCPTAKARKMLKIAQQKMRDSKKRKSSILMKLSESAVKPKSAAWSVAKMQRNTEKETKIEQAEPSTESVTPITDLHKP